jgi:hypothetical protein
VVALASQGVGKLGYGQRSINGVVGWAVLVARAWQQNPSAPDPAPNSRPWEHMADISEMPDELRVALGG